MERRFTKHFPLLTLLFLWLVMNLVQGYYMGLGYDEAYYWTLSRFLDFGYYDHPPMVALLIAAGYNFFHNEFGVRLFFVVTCTAIIYVLYRQTDRRDMTLFFMLIAGTTLYQVTGVGVQPSTPLLFFTALYFIIIKRYIVHDDWKSIIQLSIVIPLMCYSKYHAVLVLLCTILADPSLLRRKSFWYIFLFSCILFSPHIFWQISHGFPTLKFHLQERYVDPYSPVVIPVFLIGQIIFTGPLMGFVTVPAILKFRTTT
ncbi:MAG TPA: glycosyltransferase family 39 protein, partial [Bacteroidota bacterium]|nr:glycosyltransferase family 39 protein [Bacteroidota bacterium]